MDDRAQLVLEAAELRVMLDKAAADDVRDLRHVMADWRAVKRGVFTSLAGFGVLWHLRKGP